MSKCVEIDDLTLFFGNGGQPICVQTSCSGSSLLYRSEIVIATAQFVDASDIALNASAAQSETPYFPEDETTTTKESAGTMPPIPPSNSSSQFSRTQRSQSETQRSQVS